MQEHMSEVDPPLLQIAPFPELSKAAITPNPPSHPSTPQTLSLHLFSPNPPHWILLPHPLVLLELQSLIPVPLVH